MRLKNSFLSLLLLIPFTGAFLTTPAQADPVYKTTTVTFTGPVEIPGRVLLPGTYVMNLLQPLAANHNIVRFYNADQTHMYGMVFAVPAYRVNITPKTVITFEERAGNTPPALHTWFYPFDHWGEQFVYSKAEQPAPAVTAPAPLQPRPTPVPEVKPAPQPQAEAQPQKPVEVAQAAPPAKPAPAPEQRPAPPTELPHTASSLPLEAIAGAAALLTGVCLRRSAV
jgi:outer membrane biosynthesis protein TonB